MSTRSRPSNENLTDCPCGSVCKYSFPRKCVLKCLTDTRAVPNCTRALHRFHTSRLTISRAMGSSPPTPPINSASLHAFVCHISHYAHAHAREAIGAAGRRRFLFLVICLRYGVG